MRLMINGQFVVPFILEKLCSKISESKTTKEREEDREREREWSVVSLGEKKEKNEDEEG